MDVLEKTDRGAAGTHTGQFAAHVFDAALSVDSYVAGTFRSGVPSGVLKVEQQGLTQDQATAPKTAWIAASSASPPPVGARAICRGSSARC